MSLKTTIINAYKAGLTIELEQENQWLLPMIDTAIISTLINGCTAIATINGADQLITPDKDTGLLSVDETIITITNDLRPLTQGISAIFQTDAQALPVLTPKVRQMAQEWEAMRKNKARTIRLQGSLLRYLNNVGQKRVSEASLDTQPRDIDVAQKPSDDFFFISESDSGAIATIGQLAQAQATPYIDWQNAHADELRAECPLPFADLPFSLNPTALDPRPFNDRIDAMRDYLAIGINQYLTAKGVKATSWEWREIETSDSATADGKLKLAQAQQIKGQNDQQ